MISVANLTEQGIYESDPMELEEAMRKEFYIEIPLCIETEEDMAKAQQLLAKCGAYYSYLAYTTLQIRIRKKKMRMDRADKDAISRVMIYEDIFQTFTDLTKQAFSTISRMLSVKSMQTDANRASGKYAI